MQSLTEAATRPLYEPAPGSLVERVLLLLARNPDAEYSHKDLANEIEGAGGGSWVKTMQRAMDAGYCKYLPGEYVRDPGVWRAGRHLAGWFDRFNARQHGVGAYTAPAPTPAPALSPATVVPTDWPARPAKPSRRGVAYSPLPVPDVATLQVEKGVKVIKGQKGQPGKSKWLEVFDLLKEPGDSVPLDRAVKGAVYAFAKKAQKAGVLAGKYEVGGCPKNPKTHCRLLRVA